VGLLANEVWVRNGPKGKVGGWLFPFRIESLTCRLWELRRGWSRVSDVKHVRVEWDGEFAVVTIDRQDKLNALNADVVRELLESRGEPTR
jgi:hypothetical protein